MLTYYLLRVAAVVAPRFPAVVGYCLAVLFGDLSFILQPRTRKSAMENLRRVVGGETTNAEILALVRQAFRTQAMNYYDLFRVPRLTLEDVRRIVTLRGEEHLQAALARGKGVILIAAHLGNLDIAIQVAVTQSYSLTLPVEHIQPEKLFALVSRLRADKGVKLVPVDNGALKAIYRALNKNELVVIAADRDVLRSGARVEFFGQETTLPDSPAVLSLRTGAPVLPVRCIRNSNRTFTVDIFPPLALRNSGNLKDDIRNNTRTVTETLESFIRENPEQWLVFGPVWNVQDEKVKLPA